MPKEVDQVPRDLLIFRDLKDSSSVKHVRKVHQIHVNINLNEQVSVGLSIRHAGNELPMHIIDVDVR